jgi:hypothetical protein
VPVLRLPQPSVPSNRNFSYITVVDRRAAGKDTDDPALRARVVPEIEDLMSSVLAPNRSDAHSLLSASTSTGVTGPESLGSSDGALR